MLNPGRSLQRQITLICKNADAHRLGRIHIQIARQRIAGQDRPRIARSGSIPGGNTNPRLLNIPPRF